MFVKRARLLFATILFALATNRTYAKAIVLSEAGFPTVDASPTPEGELRQALPGADLVAAEDLPRALAATGVDLLVLPYGSAFPEEDWRAIYSFLQGGGNMLSLGGRPFTRPAYRLGGKWELRPETYAYIQRLLISDYQTDGNSPGLEQVTNRDLLSDDLPAIQWSQAYSVVVRLSGQPSSPRIGASGTPDSQLRTVVWGTRDRRKIAAPVIEIDHFQNGFMGGRWIMVNCDTSRQSPAFPGAMISRLAGLASAGASQFTAIPTYPLYLPGERPSFTIRWIRRQPPPAATVAKISIARDGTVESESTASLVVHGYPFQAEIPLTASYPAGFHTAVVKLMCGQADCGIYRTGFWVRDESYLASGPKITVDHDFFLVGGRPLPVVGTTYMDSESQRLFLRYPNPYVWDRDMRQISENGLNMLRTGLWTDWDEATGGTGIASEHTLRTIEAFLMTARKYNLPVQFNLFAFMPEVFGGGNAYLDIEALRREHAFVESIVGRFKDVPFLMWDLINEPSFDNPGRFFGTKPNGDATELEEWSKWLLQRHGSREAIASVWKTVLPPEPLPVPADQDFAGQDFAGEGGQSSLSVYDFNLFAQDKFTDWVQGMRQVIRNAGSTQLITVGTDEGGGLGSVSPAFFRSAVDFTTMHSWWLYDDLLWDSLVAKQSGLPMLVQETGVMYEPGPDGRPRRSLDNEAALLERKVAIALGTGAGAIEWLWNINALMQSQQEVTIGAVRWDGTEKPEAEVLRSLARFAGAERDHFRNPVPEQVAILTSQALQYSPMSALATQAQQRSVRAINYECRIPARVVSENNVGDIAGSKLVVLPSAQALSDSTWTRLMDYVSSGGNLLITGSIERDECWQRTQRLRDIGIDAAMVPLNYRGGQVDLGDEVVSLSFDEDIQKHGETLKMAEGRTYAKVKRGMGEIFVVAYPVELAESPDATAKVYQHVLSELSITPPFTPMPTSGSISPSVLVRPEIFEDSILYLLESESALDQRIDIKDKWTGAELNEVLPAQRTRLVLIQKGSGAIIATYDGPILEGLAMAK